MVLIIIAAHVLFLPGCAFVTFTTREAAIEAQKQLHEKKTLPGVSLLACSLETAPPPPPPVISPLIAERLGTKALWRRIVFQCCVCVGVLM